jgi:hypothetical protein
MNVAAGVGEDQHAIGPSVNGTQGNGSSSLVDDIQHAGPAPLTGG